MNRISVRSTSRNSAIVEDVVLRDGDQVRLIFRPEIVNNPNDPSACIRGEFLYQRKRKKDTWEDFAQVSLAKLKGGEGFRLEIHAGEMLALLKELAGLYRLHVRKVYRREISSSSS